MDYETFTRDRIAKLRAEADALERNLKEFAAISTRPALSPRRALTERSAIATIMKAIEEAGPAGLTLDEMIAVAAKAGFEAKRNTLRSQLWNFKNEERVVQLEPGRYAAASPKLPSMETLLGTPEQQHGFGS
jgi:hypothetical protein